MGVGGLTDSSGSFTADTAVGQTGHLWTSLAMDTQTRPCTPHSSFSKLIGTFVSELGELEQEMAQTSPSVDRDSDSMVLQGLEGEVSGVFLQSPPCEGSAGERDSGYDSLRRRMSVLDRLTQTHTVWLLLSLSDLEATRILLLQPPGVFLVSRSSKLQRKVLLLRADDASGVPVVDFPVKESQYTLSLEGSGISFADLFRLVAFYCISRDVLPFTLKLPDAVASARTQAELEEVAQLGAGFWDSALGCQRRTSSSPSHTHTQERARSLHTHTHTQERARSLHTHTHTQERARSLQRDPAEEGQARGRAATRQESGPLPALRTRPAPSRPNRSRSVGALCFVNPLFAQTHRSLQGGAPPGPGGPPAPDPARALGRANSRSHLPPPRPPPPRSLPRRPAPPQQGSMPETGGWLRRQQQQQRASHGPMGAKPSSPKKASAPQPPPRPRRQPDVDGLRCTIALDDETIAKALSRAKLPHASVSVPSLPAARPQREEVGQRLSDMSLSTSSSDSLDFPHSHSHSHSHTHTRSSLGLPPSRALPADNDSEDEDEEEEEEEEENYGVGLEQDLQLRLRSSCHCKKLPGGGGGGGGGGGEIGGPAASLFILPRALKGKFRKVSGALGGLVTAERRAVRRIGELARDKRSYFGRLVQDYVGLVQESRGGHTSALDLLQTLRQFLTQMKAYLLQSSELDPPIESLIPEDQIDAVLEKAMHKCVLKPLRGVVEAALHDFQVSSGEWQQLKENLTLAKAKRPQELGVDAATPPDPVAIEKIRHKFQSMRKMYSPEKKVSLLLRVCKLIYSIMQDNSGRMFGADDFLPMLTYVLAQCDMPQLDSEILYMMELLDPALLHGEGGYYLTSAYGAMSLIKNFQEEQAVRVLSSEARNTLHQWHRRRTAQRTAPSVDDFQNYLRVALQEPDSGCTGKTLLVRPYATTEEVCALCARKFCVADPENHALFLLTEETSQQLNPDTHPQRIKAELHSRPHPRPFHFVYRRLPGLRQSHSTNGHPD